MNLINFPSALLALLVLLCVAILTLTERKWLGFGQRRLGPNTVGVYGTLQPFADALKLLTKENIYPVASSTLLFILAPMISLATSLTIWMAIPLSWDNFSTHSFGWVSSNLDEFGILIFLAILAISVYGSLLAGWASNSSYSFLGSLRSTATMVSYEIVLSCSLLIAAWLADSFSMAAIALAQNRPFAIVLPTAFLLFAIALLAETSRTPFDLLEAESELVSGYMTEFASVLFVAYFLAEYTTILAWAFVSASLWFGCVGTFSLIAVIIAIILYVIAARALLPRFRYDQLITLCWAKLIPVAFAHLLIVPVCTFWVLSESGYYALA